MNLNSLPDYHTCKFTIFHNYSVFLCANSSGPSLWLNLHLTAPQVSDTSRGGGRGRTARCCGLLQSGRDQIRLPVIHLCLLTPVLLSVPGGRRSRTCRKIYRGSRVFLHPPDLCSP